MYALVIQSIIKNIEAITIGKLAIYFICMYAMLLLVYRLIWHKNYLIDKDLILGYLFIISAIIPCLIYKFVGLYNDVVMIAIYVIMFLIVSNFNKCENIKEVKREFISVANFTSIVFFIYSIASLLQLVLTKGKTNLGLINKSDFYSFNCITIIGVALFLYLNNIYKQFNLINIIFHVVIIFSTYARVTIASLVLSFCLLVMLLLKENEVTKKTLHKYVGLIVCIVVAFLIMSVITNINFNILFTKIAKAGLSGREIIWPFAINVFLQNNIIFGVSYGAQPVLWSKYFKDVGVNYGSLNKEHMDFMLESGMSHSIYLQQLCSHGIIGLILMIALLLKLFKAYVTVIFLNDEYDRFTKYLFYASLFSVISQLIIGLVANSIFFNIIYMSQIMFFYFIGFMFYLVKYNNQ